MRTSHSFRPPRRLFGGRARRALGPAILVALGAAVVGACSSEPAQKKSAGPGPVRGLPSTEVAADEQEEAARVGRYLESVYRRQDVVYSFRTKFGEDIDCVDFFDQPVVRAAIARGEQVTVPQIPKLAVAPERNEVSTMLDDVAFNGAPDENGHPRRCPENAVPYVRTTAEQVRAAGGLKAYMTKNGAKPMPPRPNQPTSSDVQGFMHVIAEYPIANQEVEISTSPAVWCPFGPAVYGGTSTASVHTPYTPAGHSLSQTWTFTGGQVSDLVGCNQCTGPNCTQSIELGWTVDFARFNDQQTRLFLYSTQDGYWMTGCYDGQPCMPPGCACEGDGDCELVAANFPNDLFPNPFHRVPGAIYAPGQVIMNIPTVNKTPMELTFQTLLASDGNWYVLLNGQPLGFFPPSTWNGTFASPHQSATEGAPMAKHADFFWAGGEVAGVNGPFSLSNPSVNSMGTGFGAPLGYKWSAYHRNIAYAQTVGGPYVADLFSAFTADSDCYNVGLGVNGSPFVGSAQPGGSHWGSYMYYGGLGSACGFPFNPCDACCTTAAQNGLGTDTACDQTGIQPADPCAMTPRPD